MRLKLNDIGSSNGEFIFFFDDQLKVHLTDMSNMVPDETFEISHARFSIIGLEHKMMDHFISKIII